MANDAHSNPDSEASKWFTIAVVAVALYVTVAFTFVITSPVEPNNSQPEVHYGQHN
jgi:hypothetical protein